MASNTGGILTPGGLEQGVLGTLQSLCRAGGSFSKHGLSCAKWFPGAQVVQVFSATVPCLSSRSFWDCPKRWQIFGVTCRGHLGVEWAIEAVCVDSISLF